MNARLHIAERIPWVRPRVLRDAWLSDAMAQVLDGGTLTNQGPHAVALERELGQWLGAPTAVVSSGATALELALVAATRGMPQRRAAILPACTFVATLNAVERAGLEPVFADIRPRTWTLDPDAVAEILARRTDIAAVIPVNAFGTPPELAPIAHVTHQAGAVVVYDNAHGLGTLHHGSPLPHHADITAWSLHATKVLPAGEGGFITSRHVDWLASVRQLRNHGLAEDVLQTAPGQNAKMSELHAVVARAGLMQLDAILDSRRQSLTRLSGWLRAVSPRLVLQERTNAVTLNGQNLTVVVTDATGTPDARRAEAWRMELATHGVGTRRYFWPPLHELARFQANRPSLPVTEAVMPAFVSLPLHTAMTDATLADLEAAIRTAWEAVQ